MEMPVITDLGKHRKWSYIGDMTTHSGLDCSNKGMVSKGLDPAENSRTELRGFQSTASEAETEIFQNFLFLRFEFNG